MKIAAVCLALAFTFLTTECQDLFYFTNHPASQDVNEGTEAVLRCHVSTWSRQIVYHWEQGGVPIENTFRRFQDGSDLRIRHVLRRMDEGPFRCIATNTSSRFSLQSQLAFLNIQCS